MAPTIQVLRNQGKFNNKLPLERYPFDEQRLSVALEDSTASSGRLAYVPDVEPVEISNDLVIPGMGHRRSDSRGAR